MTGAAPGEVCGVCAAPLRAGGRFCGRCGAEQGLMVPREQGVGEAREVSARDRRPLRARGLIVAIVGYFAMFLPGMYFLGRSVFPTADEIAAVSIFGGFVGLAGLGFLGLGAEGLRTMIPRPPPPLVALLAIAATAAIYGGVRLFAHLQPDLFIDIETLLALGSMSTAMALVHIAVIPAVTEEILFRGAVLGGLTDLMRDRTAVIASALIFATAHLSVPSMPHLVALGLVLGWVRVRSGSIWPGVLLHGGYNAAVYLAPVTGL
jgi:membrane protease YdiL (CAAX protease family)